MRLGTQSKVVGLNQRASVRFPVTERLAESGALIYWAEAATKLTADGLEAPIGALSEVKLAPLTSVPVLALPEESATIVDAGEQKVTEVAAVRPEPLSVTVWP